MNCETGTVINVQRTMRACADVAFDVVYNVESFPTFMPHIKSAEVLYDDGERKKVLWDMTIDGAPLTWTEDIVYKRDCFRAEFVAIDGAFERFDGFWEAKQEEAGATLEVSLVYNLGLSEIEDIIGPILEARLRENLETMLDSIDKRTATS